MLPEPVSGRGAVTTSNLNLDPGQAYSNGLTLLTNVDALEQGASYSSQMFGGELPIFLQDWFSFLVLLALFAAAPQPEHLSEEAAS